ncbi:uncharacterized protein LOC119341924 [Triticum dicoccoides]|uniref:uncharacterized protein LOC119341924 n=1 Tax=Triticum dicoccoides TaxID=85692 RepID=UPI0018912DBA|nr:uncharacterized protein LOC119341924 [Triticum dicoccoides]
MEGVLPGECRAERGRTRRQRCPRVRRLLGASDLRQKWFIVTSPHPSAPFELPPPFVLQNAQTFQVIIIPSGSGQKVRLSSEPPINPLDWLSWSRAALEQRWTPEKCTRADHFYQLSVTKSDPALTLNGLLGNVHDGTEVGIYHASPDSGNAIWQMTSYPLCAR